jgi:NIPSNAP
MERVQSRWIRVMIYEIDTYQLKVGSLTEVEKRYGEAYEQRKKYSPLAAFWRTEVGPLNEIIAVWRYADLAERSHTARPR